MFRAVARGPACRARGPAGRARALARRAGVPAAPRRGSGALGRQGGAARSGVWRAAPGVEGAALAGQSAALPGWPAAPAVRRAALEGRRARPGRRQAAVMGPARPTGATARRARGRASRPRALLSNRRPILTKTSAGLVEGRALLPPQGALLAAKVRRFRDLAVALAGVGGAPAVETGVHIHAARVHAVGHVARGAESWVLVEGADAATEEAAGSVVAAWLFDRADRSARGSPSRKGCHAPGPREWRGGDRHEPRSPPRAHRTPPGCARAVGPWLHARHLRASGRRGRRIRPRAQRTGALSKKSEERRGPIRKS